MDTWSNDQVDLMKRNGNANVNRTFNPHNTKPSIPLDVDEVDTVLEKFIRQKYDQQIFSNSQRRPAARNDTGSTRSSEDQPPPLPPKPGKRFGFGLRSASSALPLQRNGPTSPPHSPSSANAFSGPPSPLRVNKQSRVFGASIGGGGGELEAKLTQLKDMGFHDERRNAQILKGLGGNLERTIESLVRLGEGSTPDSRSRTPNLPRNVAVSQPLPPPPNVQTVGVVNGLSFENNGMVSPTSSGSQGQPPHQNIDPMKAQVARNFTSPDPYQQQQQPPPPQTKPYNPFDTSDSSLQNAFQGMQISTQPLFPNATGGYPSHPPQPQETRFQTMTPPVPQVPQQYMQHNPYAQPSVHPPQNYNPFYQSVQQSVPAPFSTNPYTMNIPQQTVQPQNISQQQQESIPQPLNNGYSTEASQVYSSLAQNGSLQQRQPGQHHCSNPYIAQHSVIDPAQHTVQNQNQPNSLQNQPQVQQTQSFNPFQPQPLLPQQTGRVDKSSILALYNYPQLAPPPLPTNQTTIPSDTAAEPTPGPEIKTAHRSVTMPVQLSSGSRNPFQTATPLQVGMNGHPPAGFRHASQESVDVGGLQNGRHSPDAFASLSARYVR
ncbi:Protein gts1 [Lecanora helva]